MSIGPNIIEPPEVASAPADPISLRLPGAASAPADPMNLRLLVLDCDGVLTDGGIIYNNQRIESKHFSARDGLGVRLLSFVGIQPAVVTGRTSELLAQRCADLRITRLLQHVNDKRAAVEGICAEMGIGWSQVAAMGDDWNDWPVLGRAGLCAAPADAATDIRRRVHYITPSPGGHGAVRDFIEYILRLRDQHDLAIQAFLDTLR